MIGNTVTGGDGPLRPSIGGHARSAPTPAQMDEYKPRPHVLIIEDEPHLREALVSFLNMDGFIADGVGALHAAEQWMNTHQSDIILLDLSLPDGDGLEWFSRLSNLKKKGLIAITARSSVEDRLKALSAGVDAYLIKPVLLDELSLHINNLFRRLAPTFKPTWRLEPNHWSLVAPSGLNIKLTHSELTILKRLMTMAGKAVRRDVLVTDLGHAPQAYDSRRMEVLVRRLRAKVKKALGYDIPLETVHGVGYAFVGETSSTPD